MNIIGRNSIFDDDFDLSLFKNSSIMKTDIIENNNSYLIKAELPGFKKEDIKIDFDRGYLSISATKNENIENSDKYLRRERFYGEIKRTFYVGDILESEIKANYQNGILNIIFPKEIKNNNNKKYIDIE